MEESEDNMNSEDVSKVDSPLAVRKTKKRSLVERELETNMTARVTSPAIGEGLSMSRYGRARRLKTESDLIETQKVLLASIKSPDNESTPVKVQSPVYRMHASNSPHKAETPKKALGTYLDNQIDNIYQENICLSRFSDETGTPSPAKKFPKVYIRKDLIQNREEEETIMLIKNLFSPTNSASKPSDSHLSSVHSTEKYNTKQNGLVDNSSVVKTLDFDSNKKKKKEDKAQKSSLSKNDLFEVEAKCAYQVGDLAWARMGTFPFWPCIVTRDPYNEMFVKKKLFGRVERDLIHVTFFGDNGRRSWLADNMLRNYSGQLEFHSTRERFTPEDKKKDPKLYAAFFISEKKLPLWKTSVEEAENLFREPKRLRIDIFNDMLWKSRASKKQPKSGKISSRTNSDVSLSESLYDSLFSAKEVKPDDAENTKKSKNKSFDVSEVVTACLDNMAAKTGITKIQRQSHMDRWLQKAKSKTPEKTQAKPTVSKLDKLEKAQVQSSAPIKLIRRSTSKINTKPPVSSPSGSHAKPYRFRKRTESHYKMIQESKNYLNDEGTCSNIVNDNKILKSDDMNSTNTDLSVISNGNKEYNFNGNSSTVVVHDDDNTLTQPKNEPVVQHIKEPVNYCSAVSTDEVKLAEHVTDNVTDHNLPSLAIIAIDDGPNELKDPIDIKSITNKANDTLSYAKKGELLVNEIVAISSEENMAVSSNELNAAIQVTHISKNSEEPDEDPSTFMEVDTSQSVQNSDVIKTHPAKLTKKKSQICDEVNSSISVSDVSQDCLMKVVENTNYNESEKSSFCKTAYNSIMEIDEHTNFDSQTIGDTHNSETVSNKRVDDNVTDLKEAQNVVSIEVSVTEKKNDDTLNNLRREGEQESINKLNPSQIIETKVDAMTFLDKRERNEGIVELNDMLIHSSTPDKYKRAETTDRKSSCILKKRLNLEGKITDSNPESIFCNENEIIEVKDDINISSTKNLHIVNGIFIDDEINVKDCRNNILNESSNSESILQLCTNDTEIEKDEAILETSFSDSIKSESILESNQIYESVNKNDSITETAENFENLEIETGLVAAENASTRQYVESPTFTQLLDSEEFFRDENETYHSPKNMKNLNSECPEPLEIMANDVKKSAQIVTSNKVHEDFDEDDENTSEDEPSPEYESLDDEITEDFRKHMISIESNIKDKKDEEQIVKICNEIAEKAKLSPTKYTQDEEFFKSNNKLDQNVKCVPITSPGRKYVKLKDDTIHKENVNTCPLHTHHINSTIENQINTKILQADTTKKFNLSETQTKKDIRTDLALDNHEDITASDRENSVKTNGDASMHKINDKPKIIYKTRSSVGSATKDRASPAIKNESSKVKKYRKSCEYEPKVVIIRLERDKIKYSTGTSKPKSLDEHKSKYNNKSRICLTNMPDDKSVENDVDKNKLNSIETDKSVENDVDKNKLNSIENDKPVENDVDKNKLNSIENDKPVENDVDKNKLNSIEIEDHNIKNRKSRLSLKRDSPRSKQQITENKIVENQPAIKVQTSENCTSEQVLNKEEIITETTVPKEIEMKTDVCVTNIHEPVKVNGYHHNIDRKFTDTPDSLDDTDFDVDGVSLNSEDSEISLPNSIESIPTRNLRSRPERKLENALGNPEFLKYLELRQDYLMDLHPELNEDELVSYIYKTWQYEEDLKSDTKKIYQARNSPKQEIPRIRKSEKTQPKNSLKNSFREKYEKSRDTIDSESGEITNSIDTVEQKAELIMEDSIRKIDMPVKLKKLSKSPSSIDLTSDTGNDTFSVKDKVKEIGNVSVKSEENMTSPISSLPKTITKSLDKVICEVEDKPAPEKAVKNEQDIDTESIDSEDSEIPLRLLRSRVLKENNVSEFKKEISPEKKIPEVSTSKNPYKNNAIKDEADETGSTVSDNEPLVKQKNKNIDKNSIEDPLFIQYLELKQDALMDENPQLTHKEIVQYLHKIWLYEENSKSALEKQDELEQQANAVKGLNNNEVAPSKKVRRRPKIEQQTDDTEVVSKDKPRRKVVQPFYNENYSDIEDELEVFEIFKTKKTAVTVVSKAEVEKSPTSRSGKEESPVTSQTKSVKNDPEQVDDVDSDVEYVDETELYFTQLTQPKPNVFKGLVREKVCDICEYAGSLVKCKGCYGMFHPDCVKKQTEPNEVKECDLPLKARKKKRKSIRKPRGLEDSESHSDEKSHDLSADTSIEEIVPPNICTVDADYFESQIELKIKEMLDTADVDYDSSCSDDGIDWGDSVAGKCEIVDVKLKRRDPPADYSDFKCHNCRKYDTPVCFVCKSAVSKTDVETRQKCHVAHCHKHYHLECLDHWPQTQFNSGERARSGKRSGSSEALACPRHVCHTCVSDNPRGCNTRFSGDKLARCVRCPATYHAFNKCLPAGSRLLSASHVICPRHADHRAGKLPCHVNTGWCFLCAQGGSLICCEYCPTSFHAECLNIKPPEGNYMCEECETGRLPLYGEMVWVKLGQYRWWPGIILHPSEIPENIMLVKHELGEFVVRFFGQYDHYWVNRGRVFPYQEGDSGRISNQKSKINADFILAIEHAQRAYAILKNASPDEEESLDIASSLLPPLYVKLKSNKPSGSLCGRKIEDPSLSLTQCECNPDEPVPCGPYSQCLNRMLLTECGPTCRAGERCNNRAFEKRLYPKLVPYRTPHRGWGLKTLEDIKAGQFVIEYVGELIDEEEFRRRMRRKHEIRDENYYFLTLDKERMIDAGPKGNVARFMNHCCEPNCETQKWTVLGDVRVGLFAIDDIPAESEVTFNYNLQCAGIEKKRCLCGAKRCSGYIGAKPKQDESQSKKGKDGKLKRAYNKKKKPEVSPTTNKVKKRLGRPPKPKELTELEKDVLIIKNATNLSSEESSRTIEEQSPTLKRKIISICTDQVSMSSDREDSKTRTLKRKRISISNEEVLICNGQEPCVKKLKSDKHSEVGD